MALCILPQKVAAQFELWRVTADGTAEKGYEQRYQGPTQQTPYISPEFNDALYFPAIGADGSELWRVTTDGVVEQVADINPRIEEFLTFGVYRGLGGALYFRASDVDGRRGALAHYLGRHRGSR